MQCRQEKSPAFYVPVCYVYMHIPGGGGVSSGGAPPVDGGGGGGGATLGTSGGGGGGGPLPGGQAGSQGGDEWQSAHPLPPPSATIRRAEVRRAQHVDLKNQRKAFRMFESESVLPPAMRQ
jgi:hypothetical protein